MKKIRTLSDLQSLFKRQVANKHISTCPYGGPQKLSEPKYEYDLERPLTEEEYNSIFSECKKK